LERLVNDLDEPENHDFAIYQLNQMGHDALNALLKTLLHDDDVDARYGSARAIGQMCSEQKVEGLSKARAIKALITALADPEPPVRYWAAEALGRVHNQKAVECLGKLLKDPHKGVREQVRRSLQQIGGPQAEAMLEKRPGFLGWLNRD
jgi:HEAT repeat protein